ncbi:unnamed protein product [Onchocerca ochengi]|uniref:VWFD domain-containing protein n=1 Tax=Onchocerca ochengi TaxID=42157 RepID=A0A182EJ43_ONCOC|nr:unnamed protein product [Onchocerca ochengi]
MKLINIPYVRYNDWPEYRAFEDPSTGHLVCGLCGNFNGDPDDDLMMISHYARPSNHSVSHFSRSSAYDSACKWLTRCVTSQGQYLEQNDLTR